MMNYAFSLAKEMGYEQIELEVVDGNIRAKNLYEQFGFKETGKISVRSNMMMVVIETNTGW